MLQYVMQREGVKLVRQNKGTRVQISRTVRWMDITNERKRIQDRNKIKYENLVDSSSKSNTLTKMVSDKGCKYIERLIE